MIVVPKDRQLDLSSMTATVSRSHLFEIPVSQTKNRPLYRPLVEVFQDLHFAKDASETVVTHTHTTANGTRYLLEVHRRSLDDLGPEMATRVQWVATTFSLVASLLEPENMCITVLGENVVNPTASSPGYKFQTLIPLPVRCAWARPNSSAHPTIWVEQGQRDGATEYLLNSELYGSDIGVLINRSHHFAFSLHTSRFKRIRVPVPVQDLSPAWLSALTEDD